MNGKQEVITIDKLIPQPPSVATTNAIVSEGSGDTSGAQDLVSFKFKAGIKRLENETISSDREWLYNDSSWCTWSVSSQKTKKGKQRFSSNHKIYFKIDLASLKRDVENLKMKLESVENNWWQGKISMHMVSATFQISINYLINKNL